MAMDWGKAKQEVRQQLKDLPDHYTTEEIIHTYTLLLQMLKEPEIAAMSAKHRSFECNAAFPQFALAYSGLFHTACQKTPVPVQMVRAMLENAEQNKQGAITEEDAVKRAMKLADEFRITQAQAVVEQNVSK